MENDQADVGRNDRTFLETKFSSGNGDREKNMFPYWTDLVQDWQPIDLLYYALCDDHLCYRISRYFQHAHFMPIVGVRKRGPY